MVEVVHSTACRRNLASRRRAPLDGLRSFRTQLEVRLRSRETARTAATPPMSGAANDTAMSTILNVADKRDRTIRTIASIVTATISSAMIPNTRSYTGGISGAPPAVSSSRVRCQTRSTSSTIHRHSLIASDCQFHPEHLWGPPSLWVRVHGASGDSPTCTRFPLPDSACLHVSASVRPSCAGGCSSDGIPLGELPGGIVNEKNPQPVAEGSSFLVAGEGFEPSTSGL